MNLWLVYLLLLFYKVALGSDLNETFQEEIKKSLKRQQLVKRQVAFERSKLIHEIDIAICKSEQFNFIKCKYDESGNLRSYGGMFGVGVTATLYPMNSSFRIYKNCNINPDLTYQCFEKDLIKDIEAIDVFIKRENSKLSTQYKYAYLDKLPIHLPGRSSSELNVGFLMEKFMTTYISGKKVLNGFISPNVYTVTSKWGTPVHEFDRYIFMQYIEGVTLSEVLRRLRKSEIFHMKNSFRKVLRAYSNLVAARNTQYKNNDAIKRREMLLRISINNSAGEILGRFRYRLSLLDHTMNFLQRIWEKNIYHCDLCHPNIMILEEYLSDPLEITKMIKDGQGFLIDDDEYINMMEVDSLPLEITKRLNEKMEQANGGNKQNFQYENSEHPQEKTASDFSLNKQPKSFDDSFYDSKSTCKASSNSDTTCSSSNDGISAGSSKPSSSGSDQSNTKNKQGLRVIRFKLENFRVIDFSFTLDLTNEINSRKGADKYLIETPCRIYRPDRREDIIELRRFVDEAAYFASKSEMNVLADTWSTVIEELINENSSISDHVDNFLTFDKSVATQAKQFLTAIQVLQRFFKELRNNIYGPEWSSCWDNLNEWKRLKLLHKFNQMERDQLKLQSSCTIKDMTIAIHKAREQLHHHVARFKQGLFGSTLLDATSTMAHYYSVSVAPQYIESKLKEMIDLGLYKLS
ncbi:putative signal peptide-containing protein [Cryptosporidium canis]|uniref:Signal peptide-containing protein n=1 Tax=Cryptosporidium canis TaxID=195482 RepID=A0ABQ8P511_9CRYT|nr:putative signal peptide-containing protein [Cryptosporidium canis]